MSIKEIRIEHLKLITEEYEEPVVILDTTQADPPTLVKKYLLVPIYGEENVPYSVTLQFEDGTSTHYPYGKKEDT